MDSRVRTEPTTRLTIRLTAEERARVHAYAVAHDLRFSQTIRRLIRQECPAPSAVSRSSAQ